jgi:hypothetical protein
MWCGNSGFAGSGRDHCRRRRTLVEALSRVPLAEALDDGFYGSIAAMAAKSASTDPICRARSGFAPRTCNRRALMGRPGGIDHTEEKFRCEPEQSHVVVSRCPLQIDCGGTSRHRGPTKLILRQATSASGPKLTSLGAEACPLPGRKRTWRGLTVTSESDPVRTFPTVDEGCYSSTP